jgi:hypothetical protein
MKKRWLSILVLSSCCWAQIHVGGHSLNLPKRKNPKGGSPEAVLQGTAGSQESPVDSGSTQILTFVLQNIDDSQGLNLHVQQGCTSNQAPEKVAPLTYKVAITVESSLMAHDCGITFESVATKDAGTYYLHYKAGDINKIAPDFVKFRHAGSFTFKTDDGQTLTAKVTKTADHNDDSTTLMLSGGPNGMMVVAVEFPDKVETAIGPCVMQGKLKDGVGNLISTNPTFMCKLKSATVTAGN